MMTRYIALMGAEGERGYRPICRQTVELESGVSEGLPVSFRSRQVG